MNERLLTPEEVEELFDELSLRPSMWRGREFTWLRKHPEGHNWFAMKAVNGQPLGMYALYVKVLDPAESPAVVERYVDFLLRGLTSYCVRKDLEKYLASASNVSKLPEVAAREILAIVTGNSIVVAPSTDVSTTTQSSQGGGSLPDSEEGKVETAVTTTSQPSGVAAEVEIVDAPNHSANEQVTFSGSEDARKPLSPYIQKLLGRRK